MKLRFKLNQAEAFRRGIDLQKSITTIEVKPSELSQDARNLIADHLLGIDVCELDLDNKPRTMRDGSPVHVMALEPTIKSLIDGIRDADLIHAARMGLTQ